MTDNVSRWLITLSYKNTAGAMLCKPGTVSQLAVEIPDAVKNWKPERAAHPS